ncbi:MAG TPA: hypothetical protein PKD51_07095 [Saprospiraceae bacterium]|nr:hypothetical protein [Saprospiraceae bacterium]
MRWTDKMKRILVILLAIFLILATFATYIVFNYPKEWNSKILGQKRHQIHTQLGEPKVGDFWDVKADIWFKENYYSWHRLEVIYSTDTICTNYIVKFYLGNKKEFVKINLKNTFH